MRHRSVARHIFLQRLGSIVERLPRFYIAVQRLRSARKGFAGHIVSKGDVLLIDAFPRSGSSFALKAFRVSNPEIARKVGTHVHTAAHVAEAVRLGVPAMVLIRDPDGAVPSLLAMSIQNNAVVPRNEMETRRLMRLALDRYIAFHEDLLALAEHVMIVDFPEMTRDYGAVMRRLNAHFGTRFEVFDHTPENAAALMKSTRRHLSPDPERDVIKAQLRDTYAAPEFKAKRQTAKSLYDRIRKDHAT